MPQNKRKAHTKSLGRLPNGQFVPKQQRIAIVDLAIDENHPPEETMEQSHDAADLLMDAVQDITAITTMLKANDADSSEDVVLEVFDDAEHWHDMPDSEVFNDVASR